MTLGQVISELVRQALGPKAAPRVRNGVSLFVAKAKAKKPDLALVNKLRDDEQGRESPEMIGLWKRPTIRWT